MRLTKVICGLAVASLTTSGIASDIELTRGANFNLITIEGDIKAGDAEKFKRLALEIKNGVVALDSPGGALAPALEIGRAIQLAGFATYVPENSLCTSSCALIWVAGARRLLASSARVGFHASYRDNNGRLEEVGVANAMIGRYLTLLNLPERSVMFATTASPTNILWVKTDGTDRSGIEFKILDSTGGSESSSSNSARTTAPPPIQTVATAPPPAPAPATVPQWYFLTTSDGTLYYVRGQDVSKSTKSSRSAKFWLKTDDSNNKSVSYRTSMTQYNLDCVAETYKIESFTTYNAAGNSTDYPQDFKVYKVVPETIFASAAELICSDNLPPPDRRDVP